MNKIACLITDETERQRLSGDFTEISRTDAFSAIASGAATAEDFKKMRFYLLSAEIPKESCATDDNVRDIVQYIASRIFGDAVIL